jgi:hypothetical protein
MHDVGWRVHVKIAAVLAIPAARVQDRVVY